MQSRKLSSMRGASVIGVVLLLALLTTAAVTLDSQFASSPGQLAALSATPPSTGSTVSSKCETIDGVDICNGIKVGTSEYNNLTCLVGNDFIVRMNADGSDPVVYFSDKSGKVSPNKSQCKNTNSSEEVVLAREEWGVTIPPRRCTTTGTVGVWECYIKVCFRSAKLGSTDPKCVVRVDEKAKVGDKVTGSEKGVDKIIKQSAVGANPVALYGGVESEEQQKQVDTQLQVLNEGTNGGLLNAFDKEIEKTETEHQKVVNELVQARAGDQCELGYVNCDALEEKEQQLDKKLDMWKSTRDRLAAGATSLEPTPDGEKPDEKAPGTEKPPPRSDTTLGPPSDPWGLLDRNTRSRAEVEYACRERNDYQACMQLSGQAGGPGGAYGGYPGQPQCGRSGGGGGGLIGTIISLFTKNNTNNNSGCQNGVPRPQCSITASPQNIATGGQSVQLSWQSQSAFNASLSNTGNVSPQGNTTVNPQTTTTYTLFVQGYRDNYGQQASGQCSVQVTVGNQGGGGGGSATSTDPKAQISCSPLHADVGMSIAVSYACQNSVTSGGTGFSTNGQLSGSATPTIQAPTLGSNNTVTYGLTCSKEGKTDTAQCTVNVNKPTIVLVANPKNVKSGEEANIGWVTGGMDECVISSPTLAEFTAENADNTAPSGVAETPPLTQDTKFVLSCTTKSGGSKAAELTVEVD